MTHGVTPADEREANLIARASDPTAEETVVAACMTNNDHVPLVSAVVRAEDFSAPAWAAAWEAITSLVGRGVPAHARSVAAELVRRKLLNVVGGELVLDGMMLTSASVTDVQRLALVIARHARARRVLTACRRAVLRDPADPDELVASVLSDVSRAAERRTETKGDTYADIAIEYQRQLEQIATSKHKMLGIPTGFAELDRRISGLGRGRMVVLAGRPGMGKSALAQHIAQHVARVDGHVAIFTFEMTGAELWERALCSELRLDSGAVSRAEITQDDMARITAATGPLSDLPVTVYASGSFSMDDIRAAAMGLRAKSGLSLLVIDHLGLVRAASRHGSRNDQLGQIGREAKNLALELDIPVLTLAQLNREADKRPDKRPQLSELRESGQLEEHADVVLLLYRPSYYAKKTGGKDVDPNECQINVAKIRGRGRRGVVRVRFEEEFTKFLDARAESFDRYASHHTEVDQ